MYAIPRRVHDLLTPEMIALFPFCFDYGLNLREANLLADYFEALGMEVELLKTGTCYALVLDLCEAE